MANTEKHKSGADTSQDSTERLNASRPVVGAIPAQHRFGTEEELQARVGGTFETLPDNRPTTFKQIDGSKSKGGNTNDAAMIPRSGPFKFGDPHHYTGGKGGK
jgi:hypothetical protein